VGPRADDRQRSAINLRWLIRLRWGAIVGQAIVILGVKASLTLELAVAPLFVIVGIEAASNLAAELFFRRVQRRGGSVPELAAAGVMALDIVLLTGLLHLSGGSFNPFNFLYLVHIALAAVILPPRATWGLVVLSLGCFALLFVEVELGLSIAHLDHAAMMDIHLQGMWVAFAVAAVFIAYFVGRVRDDLAEREAQLTTARERSARSERLASLATLAAGAAHELSTPLSTIHLVAAEMSTAIEKGKTEAVAEDAALIREQVARCRHILEQLSDEAGASRGELPERVAVGKLLRTAVDLVERPNPIEVDVDDAVRDRNLEVPARATAQALKGLLDNACDASPPTSPIHLNAVVEGDTCRIRVSDTGEGMDRDTLARAGEPFYTTKEPGRGMGLGLFLARTIAEELEGQLALRSERGEGTTAEIVLPLAPDATFDRLADTRRVAE
jgi:two-component system sensor histidine kinase RegB